MSKEQYFNVDRWQGDFRAASQRVEVSVVTTTIILDLFALAEALLTITDHFRASASSCFVRYRLHLNLLPLSVFVPCPAVLNLFLCLSVSCPSVLTLSLCLSRCDTKRCPTVQRPSFRSEGGRYLFRPITHFRSSLPLFHFITDNISLFLLFFFLFCSQDFCHK